MKTLGAFLSGFLVLVATSAFTQQVDTLEVRVGGMARYALVHDPDPAINSNKVLVVFHGGGMNQYSMQEQLEAELVNYPDYLFVFAQAGNTHLPVRAFGQDYMTQAWQPSFPYLSAICGLDNDVNYAKTIRDSLLNQYSVDRDSIFAFGYSSGGYFTFTLMKLAPNYYQKFGVFGATSNFYFERSSFDCAEPVYDLILSESKLEGFDTLSLPTLRKPAGSARRDLYYIISPDDTTIDGLLQAGFRHPLFDFNVDNEAWFKITFIENVFRNTNNRLSSAFTRYVDFMASFSAVGAGSSHVEEYGAGGRIKIEAFKTNGGANGHFMNNYPGGKAALLANLIDFYE